jgi:hypothetical protein
VRFFLMSSSGEPAAAPAIDAVRWVALEQAGSELSYATDRELLATLAPAAGTAPATPSEREE